MVTEEQRTKIKNNVKILLDMDVDAELTDKENFIIDTVIDQCLAFCNRDNIPEDMERVVSRIAARVCVDGLDKQGGIQSYRELDMQVTYNIDADIFNEKNLLQRWVSLSSMEWLNEHNDILER